jgi:hypothetical protein
MKNSYNFNLLFILFFQNISLNSQQMNNLSIYTGNKNRNEKRNFVFLTNKLEFALYMKTEEILKPKT